MALMCTAASAYVNASVTRKPYTLRRGYVPIAAGRAIKVHFATAASRVSRWLSNPVFQLQYGTRKLWFLSSRGRTRLARRAGDQNRQHGLARLHALQAGLGRI